MEQLAPHVGSWVGTCGFRLRSTDPFHEAPATAELTTAVGGALAVLTYTWSHPENGACDGLLVVGAGEEPGTASAFWGDSFHQQPSPAAPAGTVADGVVTVSLTYAGDWQWIIVVDTSDPEVLTLRMDNVVPAAYADDPADAGAYPVMVAEFRRTASV